MPFTSSGAISSDKTIWTDALKVINSTLVITFTCNEVSRKINEPHREITGFLPMRKQRRRSASQFCFGYTYSTISFLLKSQMSSF